MTFNGHGVLGSLPPPKDGQEAKELPLGDDDDDVYLGRRDDDDVRRWFLGGSLRDNVDTSVTLKERLTSIFDQDSERAWTRGRGEAIS